MAGQDSEKAQSGYLSSAASYIPGLGGATDAAKAAPGKAQEGAGAVGDVVGGITKPVPVVGPIVEGVGKAPIAQKLGGKDEEHKGYLGTAIEYAGEAVRTVYDAAGNVIGTVSHKAGSYIPHATKEVEKAEESTSDKANEEVMQKAEEAAKKEDEATNSAKDESSKTATAAQDTAGEAAQTYSDTTGAIKDGHRVVENTSQAGIKDGVSNIQGATGTKEATGGGSEGVNDTVNATTDTARGLEDTQQKTVGGIGSGVGDMARGTTGDNKLEGIGQGTKDAGDAVTGGVSDVAGGATEGGKGALSGVADTGKGVAGAVGSGASKAGSALGGLTGWGKGK